MRMILHTFKVPVEGDDTHDEANEGEDSIDLVWKSVHCHDCNAKVAVRLELSLGLTVTW